MPTYQYACTDCGHAFEQVQSFSEDSLTVCPECEGRLRKIFNAVGVVFKGSGFYRTDSRSDNGSDKDSDKGSGDDSGTPSEKKPAPATSGDSSDSSSKSSPAAASKSSSKTEAGAA